MSTPAPTTGPAVVSPTRGSRELIDFVLTNAVVRESPGSRQICDREYRLIRRSLDHYICIFVTAGEMCWTVGVRRFAVGPGDLLLLPPSVPHAARSVRTPMAFTSLHLQVTLPGGQDVFALAGVPPLRRVLSGSRLANYLRWASTEWDRGRGDPMTRLLMPAWARLIALELLREDADRGLLEPRPVDPLVRAALNVITGNLRSKLTPDRLAATVGVSPQHLNRLFRRTLGVTALQYVTQLRMTQAAAILDRSTDTVRAVARQVGYDDPYHFSRVFARYHGLSPAHWRSRHHTARSDPVH